MSRIESYSQILQLNSNHSIEQLSTPINVMTSLCAKKKSVPNTQNKYKGNTTVTSKNISVNNKNQFVSKCVVVSSPLSNDLEEISNDGPTENEVKTNPITEMINNNIICCACTKCLIFDSSRFNGR